MAMRAALRAEMPGRRRSGFDLVGAMLAILALCLRLVSPAPVAQTAVIDPGLLAAFGEHAICIAHAGGAAAPVPIERPSAPAGHHTDHDGLQCCPLHVGTGVLAPGTTAFSRIGFATYVSLGAAEQSVALGRVTRPVQARAPPLRS